MTDIVDQLIFAGALGTLCHDAALEIRRLQAEAREAAAEVDRLHMALVAARDHLFSSDMGAIDAALADIITALGLD